MRNAQSIDAAAQRPVLTFPSMDGKIAMVTGANDGIGRATALGIGKYFEDKRQKRSSPRSYDVATAQRLWQISEHLTG